MNIKTDCQKLIDKYLSNTISKVELNQLMQMVEQIDVNKDLTESLKNHWQSATQVDAANTFYWDDKFSTILKTSGKIIPNTATNPSKKIGYFIPHYIAAAVFMLLLTVFSIYLNNNKKLSEKIVLGKAIKQEVMPGGNKAFLTLSDGTSIILDSATNGLLAAQRNINIIKLSSGQLVYKTNYNLKSENEVQYNTMRTPKGGQFQLTLPDNTQVWLNSASSIHFPTSFSGIDRKVDITGEVYFEVTKNASQPFTVSVNGMDVKVMGTHFNVNAYNDDDVIKTTLLEGAVKVTKGKATLLLQPGSQAQLNNFGEIKLQKNIDVEQTIAWKKGYFYFKNSSLKNVMQQLSRWYDVEVLYEGEIPERTFGGELSRSLNISEILQVLAKSKVRLKVEGKKIIVQPYYS